MVPDTHWALSNGGIHHIILTHPCPSIDEWINKVGYIRTTEYDSTLKRKKSLTHTMTWMYLKDVTLSKRGHTQKDKGAMTPLV